MITIHNELLTQICNRQFPKETQVVILNQISELFLLLVQYLMEPSLFYYHQELLGSLKKCTYKLDNKGGKWRFILSCYNVFGERFVVVLYRIRRMIHR